MKLSNLRSEAATLLAKKVEEKKVIQMSWIANELFQRHNKIEGDDAALYQECFFKEVNRILKSCIGAYDQPEDPTDPQMVMDGFTYLQKAYTVERNGERVLVPAERLYRREALMRAGSFRNMSQSLANHASELEELAETLPDADEEDAA